MKNTHCWNTKLLKYKGIRLKEIDQHNFEYWIRILQITLNQLVYNVFSQIELLSEQKSHQFQDAQRLPNTNISQTWQMLHFFSTSVCTWEKLFKEKGLVLLTLRYRSGQSVLPPIKLFWSIRNCNYSSLSITYGLHINNLKNLSQLWMLTSQKEEKEKDSLPLCYATIQNSIDNSDWKLL